MPTHPSQTSYSAYSPDLSIGTPLSVSPQTAFSREACVLDSPSKTLHLYERRQLPPLPSASVAQSVLEDFEAIETDSDYSDVSDVESVRPKSPLHIVECQKAQPREDSSLSSQLSVFPLPLNTKSRTEGLFHETPAIAEDSPISLSPPKSKFARSPPPVSAFAPTAADVPCGASTELEKHHSSWSIAVYSPTNTIALFRFPINRKRTFMRQQTTKNMSRVAMICAGPSDPLKVTVTGYLDKPSELPEHQLPNSLWTCKVFSLCQEVGHVAALSLQDYGIAGLHSCCHAEKQSVAYLHYQHPELRKATIHLSDDPCSDCARFLRRYQMKSGKEIEIVVYGWKWQDPTIGRHFGTSLRTML